MNSSFPIGGEHAAFFPFGTACGSSVECGQLVPSGELAAGGL
jgi:hypothetical protein